MMGIKVRMIGAMCLIALMAVAQVRAQAPEVLTQVPEGAPVVVVVPSLSGLSEDIAMLNEQLELNQPELRQPLEMLKAMTGLMQGLDDNGSMALVVLSLDPEAQEPPVVVVLPVQDYAALLSNFGAEPTEGVTQVQLPDGETGFVKQVGDYAVLGSQQELVQGYQAGNVEAQQYRQMVGELAQPVLEDSDVLLFMNVARVSDQLRSMVQDGFNEARQEMRDQSQAEMNVAILDVYQKSIDAILRDAQAMVMGLNIAQEGLAMSWAGQFKEGSQLAEAFAEAPEGELKLDRLPAQPYLYAATMDLSTLPLQEWIQGLIGALEAQDDPMSQALAQMYQSNLGILPQASRMQQAWYAPDLSGMGMAGLMNMVSVYETEDPEAFMQAQREAAEAMGQLSTQMTQPGTQPGQQTQPQAMQGMSFQATYREGAMQVAGRSVDQIVYQFNLPPQAMQEMAGAGPLGAMVMSMMAQGFEMYLVPLDNAVVLTTVADPMLMEQAIEAATTEGGLEAMANLDAVQQRLPGSRIAEMYVGVEGILQTANNFLAMMAPEAVFQVPENLPPLAAGVSVQEGGLMVKQFVPMETIVAVKDVILQVQAMQQGQMQQTQPEMDLERQTEPDMGQETQPGTQTQPEADQGMEMSN